MALKISLDHPTLCLKNKIQELSSNFLKTNGLSYFQYLRCYSDGSVALLTNDTSLMEHFSQLEDTPAVFSSFNDEHEIKQSYWFLWDEELPKGPVALARENYKICNGLTKVRRTKNYYDMIAVAAAKDPCNAGSFYLNKLNMIEDFIDNFDIENRELIELMNKNPIALPKPYRDPNYTKMCLSNKRLPVHGKQGLTYLTQQEMICLKFYCLGESYKQIGQRLEISPRTVETYLQRCKQRTGFLSRAELSLIAN